VYASYSDEIQRPIYVERQTDLPKPSPPMLRRTASPPFAGLHGRSVLFRSSSRGEHFSIKMELDSPGSGYYDWQTISELESPCPFHPGVSKTSQEPHAFVGTGSCKRLHLSHPRLCKKIVQKALRALSKLGRKPGSKTYRNSDISVALHQDCITFINSARDANLGSVGSYGTQPFELPAGDGAVYELPAEKAVADIAAVYEAPGDSSVRHKPQHPTSGHYSDTISPQTSFDRYSGSGSNISTWNQTPWWSSSSTRYSSNSDELGFTNPRKGLSELGDSSASSSNHAWPVTGENAPGNTIPIPAGTFDRPKLDVGVTAATEPIYWQKQPSEDSIMGNWDLCASPTSLLPGDGLLDRQIEDDRVHELDPANCGAYQSTTHEAAATTSSFDDVITLENSRKSSSILSTWSSSDASPSDECRITMPLCPCHELPMRPDMDLSDLVAGAQSCGVSLHTLVRDNQDTLCGRIQSMFSLLLKLARTKLDPFNREMRTIPDPTLEAVPTFQASLKALYDLHAGRPLSSIHELVSLVFMAFSIAILTIDESDLSQYAGVMCIEIASWTEALPSLADKQAFSRFLEIMWLPQVRCSTVPFQEREFCPFTNPKGLPTPDWRSSQLLNPIGLRTGVTVRLCQRYVDCKYSDLFDITLTGDSVIHHAAENEVASGMCTPGHLLGKDPPPAFVDLAMAFMAPYLEPQVSETMREVASSTVQAVRNGKLSSFDQINEHLKFEVHNRPGHFGDLSSRMSQSFSTLCRHATATFARQKIAWLMRTLQDSGNRVVSPQIWAEDVNPPALNMQMRRHGTTPGLNAFAADSPSTGLLDLNQSTNSSVQTRSLPGLNKSPATRKTGRQRKVLQDIIPSICSKCGAMFEGKYHRDHLRRHLKSHSNRYITCELCGRRLKYRKDNIAKHLKNCHPGHGK
jgi:hypothetical protein